MRRKKSAVPATVLNGEPLPVEGVIDLDSDVQPTATDIEAGQGVGPSIAAQKIGAFAAEQAEQGATVIVKSKRKYTRRKKANSGANEAVTPTFVDRDAIRTARVQAYIDYVDGKLTFDAANSRDERLKQLDLAAQQIDA